jgi:hypothetical protein
LRDGRVEVSEVREGIDSSEDGSAAGVVDGEAGADGECVTSFAGSRSSLYPVVAGGVEGVSPRKAVFISDVFVVADSETRGFFDGVSESARPPQRADRFKGGVVVGVGAAAAEPGFWR